MMLLFCAALLLCLPARAATEIPFSYRDGMIWLKVKINEKAANFLLDSGAGVSVVDAATARRMGLKKGAPVAVRGTEGQCAAWRLEDFAATVGGVPAVRTAIALDLSPVSRNCGTRIDGLLGLDFFRGRIVQIDYAARKIRLFERGESIDTQGEVVKLLRRNDTLCIRARVDGNSPEWMRLDTGCSSSVEWVASAAKVRRSESTSIATSAGSPVAVRTGIKLGNSYFPEVRIGLHSTPMFPGEAGLLGNGLLSKFRVTVDADKARVTLARAK